MKVPQFVATQWQSAAVLEARPSALCPALRLCHALPFALHGCVTPPRTSALRTHNFETVALWQERELLLTQQLAQLVAALDTVVRCGAFPTVFHPSVATAPRCLL